MREKDRNTPGARGQAAASQCDTVGQKAQDKM